MMRKGVFMTRFLRSLYAKQQGSTVLEIALVLPVLLLLLVGAVDFGRAYYLALEVSSAAQAGAGYGAQNATDTAGMVSAAKRDAADITVLAPVATYGCECSDGTSQVAGCGSAPSCAYNVVNYVQVNTSAVYTPILPYPGIGSSFTLRAVARMRAAH
ncbi:Flp pilus assembly protein TadG [Granulicella pectinivorans]|uniref:Flp pilus assembly protein TadG n=2 Tax=Granulicella pectinivorans TaxID=474950 RepID=A0A1I6MRA3_9BACT|nr:Flp pilus assembly protein TadG [Granulicella pectinivorans]